MRTRRRVLVTDGGAVPARAALATVRALHAAGIRSVVVASNDHSMAARAKGCDHAVRVPLPNADGYRDVVTDVGRTWQVEATLPTSDVAIAALGAPGGQFLDKRTLQVALTCVGLPTVPTRAFTTRADLLAASHALPLPVVVKPADHRVGDGWSSRRCASARDVREVPDQVGAVLVQPFLRGAVTAVSGIVWCGELIAAVHQHHDRLWPLDCGDAAAARTVAPDTELERRLVHLLDGYDGIFQADLVDGHVIDVNPRPYASMALATAAGVNLPALWCELRHGRGPAEIARARTGVEYLWASGYLRGAVARVREEQLSSLAAARLAWPPWGWLRHAGVADPVPALAAARYALHRRLGR